jgi:SAM-dependent methyltransferase
MLDLDSCARVKRISLSPEEQSLFRERALQCVMQSGWTSGTIQLQALALSDRTQTYRVCGSSHSAVLKMLSPETAALTMRVHGFFSRRGLRFPRIFWTDQLQGAILSEDFGTEAAPASPDINELAQIMGYLARLHDASIMEEQTARIEFPDLAARGFPRPAELAACIASRHAAPDRARRGRILEAAAAVVEGMPSLPFLAISDIKREHFFMSRGEPVLVDLELASFWDLPAANLATLLSFPGQFTSPLDPSLKQHLVREYVKTRRTERIEPDALWRAVQAAEFLMSLTLARAAEYCRLQPGYMARNRSFEAVINGGQSVQAEIGSANFRTLCAVLNGNQALRILDLASGSGKALRDIAARWPRHRLTGLDLYPGAGTPGAVLGDARRLPFARASFDAVLCVQLLQYIPDKLALISDVHRVLRPGGLAVFAMTEHFGAESGFQPEISEIALALQSPGTLQDVVSHTVGERRVTTFRMVAQEAELRFPCEYETATSQRTAESIDCYYQSRYRWRRGAEATQLFLQPKG